jgi:uncharacterized protein DUF58
VTAESRRQALVHGERTGQAWAIVQPRRMQSMVGGIRHGRRAGGSLEFRDHRDYQPGDDLRHLDWSVFARSDKLTVKQFHEEVSPFVELILDGSRSMALEDSPKAEVALSLTAMLAAAASNSGFPFALWVAAGDVRRWPDAPVPSEWLDIPFDWAGNPDALLQAMPLLRPLSLRFLISDLLWAADPLPLLEALSHGAAAVAIVEVLAAADARPEGAGDLRLIDVESGDAQDILFDERQARSYRSALLRHRELWDHAARESGATILRCVAEDVGGTLMFDDLAAAEILRPA